MWQIILLIAACISLVIAAGAALALQFGLRPHRASWSTLLAAVTVAITSLAVVGLQTRVVPEGAEEEPWIVSVTRSM